MDSQVEYLTTYFIINQNKYYKFELHQNNILKTNKKEIGNSLLESLRL